MTTLIQNNTHLQIAPTGYVKIGTTSFDGDDINLAAGKEYQINGTQITYTNLGGTIATAQIGDTQVTNAKIVDMAATKLTGTIATARVPSLPASQITSGTFATARVPSLPASQITSGTFNTARIPSLPASQITSGTFDAARIPSLASTSLSDTTSLVRTSGDQTIGGQKTLTGAIINTGGLYTTGTVTHQGTGNRAVTIQSSNPGGGVNSELRLVTADNTNSSNPTLNTGTLKYNGATSQLEMDKSLAVTGSITESVVSHCKLTGTQVVGGAKTFTEATTIANDLSTQNINLTTGDITKTGQGTAGLFTRVSELEGVFGSVGARMVRQILPASVIGTSHQLFARYRTVKIGTGVDAHKALQSHKGSNNIQNVRVYGNNTSNRTVNDGGAVDKTNSGGDTATVQFNDSDLTSGVADHMFTSFAGYLYWGTGWDSAVQTADNRMVRVSVTATEGLNLFCDGKIVAAQSRESTHGITGGGTGVRHYVFTARGDYTAIEGHITSDDTALVTRLDFTCFSYWSN